MGGQGPDFVTTAAYPHIGQRVRLKPEYDPPPPGSHDAVPGAVYAQHGVTYRIREIEPSPSCSPWLGVFLRFVGLVNPVTNCRCGSPDHAREVAFPAECFYPVEDTDEAMEALRKVAREAELFGGMTVPDDVPKRISERRRKPGRVKA